MTEQALKAVLLDAARIYAGMEIEYPVRIVVGTSDLGQVIPASTEVEVIVRLIHKRDREITPELDMAIEFNPT